MEKKKEKMGTAQNAPKENRNGNAGERPDVGPKTGFSRKPKRNVKPSEKADDAARPTSGLPKHRRTEPNYDVEMRLILIPYMEAISRLYACSHGEKLLVRLDATSRQDEGGWRTIHAALETSRVDADAKTFKDGVMTERRWHNVYCKEKRVAPDEKVDVREFCTSFIEWCTFLFTDRKALVRELNVGRQRRFLWFRLP